MKRAKNSTLVLNSAWLFAGQGSSFLVQGLYFVILARLLGTTQYGLLAGAVALVAVVSQYSPLGSGLLFLRYVSPDHGSFRRYWGNIVLSVGLLGILLVIGLRFAGRWLVGPTSVALLVPVAISDCIFAQLGSCAGQVFQTFERMKYSAMITLLSNLLRLVLAVGMLFTLGHASAWQWAMASLLVSALSSITAFVIVTRFFGLPSFSMSLLFERAKEGFVFSVSGSTTAVYNDIDKVVLSHFGMNRANGIYSMAYRAINIGAMPVMSVVSAAFPRFFREGVKGIAAVVPMAKVLLKRTMLIGLTVSIVLFVCAPLIPYLVGKSYSESVSALRWLCLIPFFRCFHLSAGDAIAGAGHQKFRLASQSVAAGGNLALNLFLIPRYSWLGAAWASLATDASLGVMNWVALFWLAKLPAPVPPSNSLAA